MSRQIGMQPSPELCAPADILTGSNHAEMGVWYLSSVAQRLKMSHHHMSSPGSPVGTVRKSRCSRGTPQHLVVKKQTSTPAGLGGKSKCCKKKILKYRNSLLNKYWMDRKAVQVIVMPKGIGPLTFLLAPSSGQFFLFVLHFDL